MEVSPTYWLSYGGGVNSTALVVLLCEGKLPQFNPWRIIWSDTKDEKDPTYRYIADVIEPYLARYSKALEKVSPALGVLEYWRKYSMVGSRVGRACTRLAKIAPINEFIKAFGGPSDCQIIGIDAGESGRVKLYEKEAFQKFYPLVDLGIDRDECVKIIKAAGLPVPIKSGCWHCPFMRVGEVRDLYHNHPDRFEQIVELERISHLVHPMPVHDVQAGKIRAQWGNRSAEEWRARFKMEDAQGKLPFGEDPISMDEIPCGCFDGEDEAV